MTALVLGVPIEQVRAQDHEDVLFNPEEAGQQERDAATRESLARAAARPTMLLAIECSPDESWDLSWDPSRLERALSAELEAEANVVSSIERDRIPDFVVFGLCDVTELRFRIEPRDARQTHTVSGVAELAAVSIALRERVAALAIADRFRARNDALPAPVSSTTQVELTQEGSPITGVLAFAAGARAHFAGFGMGILRIDGRFSYAQIPALVFGLGLQASVGELRPSDAASPSSMLGTAMLGPSIGFQSDLGSKLSVQTSLRLPIGFGYATQVRKTSTSITAAQLAFAYAVEAELRFLWEVENNIALSARTLLGAIPDGFAVESEGARRALLEGAYMDMLIGVEIRL